MTYDQNEHESECCKCDKTIIPSEEHELDPELYDDYYGSEEDDGDICYDCLKDIIIDNEEE